MTAGSDNPIFCVRSAAVFQIWDWFYKCLTFYPLLSNKAFLEPKIIDKALVRWYSFSLIHFVNG